MRIDSIQVAIVFKRQDDILYLLGQEIVAFQKKIQSQKQLCIPAKVATDSCGCLPPNLNKSTVPKVAGLSQ